MKSLLRHLLLLTLTVALGACGQLPFAGPPPTSTPAPTAAAAHQGAAPKPRPTLAPSAEPAPTAEAPSPTPAPPSPTFEPIAPTATLAPVADDLRLRIFDEVWGLVSERYLYEDFNGADWGAVRDELRPQAEAAATPEAFYGVMRELIDRLGDDHSRFESPQDVAAQQAEFAGDLKYGGIGAVIRDVDEGGLIISVAPGGPADQAGLQPRDLVLAVNGIAFNDPDAFGPSGPIGTVRGEPGTSVRLTIQSPNGAPRDVDVLRAVIDQDIFNQVTGERVRGTDVGLVVIPSFYVDELDTKVRAAIEDLLAEGALGGLILDVRSNSGGYVHLMRNTIALFHDGGSIGSTSGRSDREEQEIPDGRTIAALEGVPITVLISEDSASAAEMFAAGMQVLGRARIVGTPSAGNTENLYSYSFDDGSRLLLAQVAYRLPDGTLIEGRGVIPDREVDVEWWRYNPADDPQVLAAIEEIRQGGRG